MENQPQPKAPAKPTGRAYKSVSDLMKGEGVAEEIQNKVNSLAKETLIVDQLIRFRLKAGLTQKEMAERLGCTQGAVSKIENSDSRDLTLKTIADYVRATNERLNLLVGKPMNHIESIKFHAFGIQEHLTALAEMAHQDEEVEQSVKSFFGEAFLNILVILAKCEEQLPQREREFEVGVQALGGTYRMRRSRFIDPSDLVPT
jgi:transcriptional regulator with XRE-family HTH domain